MKCEQCEKELNESDDYAVLTINPPQKDTADIAELHVCDDCYCEILKLLIKHNCEKTEN
jgi:hypothetical protein